MWKLSEDDVLHRLFTPASSLPKPRNDQAIVVVSAGETERTATHSQIEHLLAYAMEQLKKYGVKDGDKVVFCCVCSGSM